MSGYIGLNELRRIAPELPLDDPGIRRYEMIREAAVTGNSGEKVAGRYNLSDTQFYKWRHRLLEEGWLGLQNRKSGSKSPRKITPEVRQVIIKMRVEEDLSITELSSELEKREGYKVSPSHLNRILDQEGLPKKKRGRKPKKQNQPGK